MFRIPKTVGDKVRTMSDEEIATFLVAIINAPIPGILQALRSPVDTPISELMNTVSAQQCPTVTILDRLHRMPIDDLSELISDYISGEALLRACEKSGVKPNVTSWGVCMESTIKKILTSTNMPSTERNW